MGKHTAHGYLVEDVYKEAEKFTKLFGFKPARIDETFAGFPMEGKVEFFLWQWKHLEDNLGKEVMAKVKYRDQQAIRCDTPEEVDEAYEQLKAEGMEFISEPKDYEWNARCVYFLDASGHMWEIYCWTGAVPLGDLDPAKEKITVETLSGIKTLWPIYNDRKVCAMKVDMGKAELTPALIPVDASKLPDPKADRIVNAPYTVDGVEYHVTCVSMGNPHCVVFKNDVETMDIEKIGPAFETSELFPERVNTEFIRVLDDHTLKMRVWERGSGETWACGTGACAAAVAAVENGYCKKDTDITVKLIGGDLVIRYTDDTVYMTGNAVTVYEGVVEI